MLKIKGFLNDNYKFGLFLCNEPESIYSLFYGSVKPLDLVEYGGKIS